MNTLWFALMMLTTTAQQLELTLGETEVIAVGASTDVIIGNPELLDVKLLDSGFLAIAAIAAGSTEIRLIDAKQQHQRIAVTITAPANTKRELTLAYILQLYPQLKRADQQQFVVLHGELSLTQQQHLASLVNDFPEVLLQLTEPSASQLDMIELNVRIFEVKRSYTQQLGIRWPQQISGPLVSSSAAQTLRFPIDVSTSLELLVRDGHARLLAEPTLSTYSGGEAEFLVGGEFPIPQVLAQGAQDVTFREYGIVLKIAPHMSASGLVKTNLSAEISSIDPALAVNGVPGILTRRVSSMIEVKLGESLALSGLLSHEQSLQSDHFPGLHQLPILGRLFSSEQFRNAETELLVVVTPRLASTRTDQQLQQQQAQRYINHYRQQIGCLGLLDQQG
ncbi:type II and III secretion system protein family protein [Pseudidiomarina mangrovi]|uniref:type II and III secretion system protein family protein n=1 Tax=Pseudidiomarina mangrovi TaxID=2487133 RepID=UPI000FC9ACC4|nr:pilus assembly protein N-terminal domain-containing protein [Pseudidiomarina mangrovi]